MSDFFHIFTVEGIQKDEAAILQVLADIKGGKLTNNIKLLNYFKELPVSFPATLEYVDTGLVEMTVHPSQAIAMQAQKMTFIKSPHLPHDVVASVNTLRIAKNRAVLFKFAYAQIRSERRESVRVEVSDRCDVSFYGGGVSLKGLLHDISLTGVSFVAPEYEAAVSAEVAGEVTLVLDGMVMQVPATLLRTLGNGRDRKFILKMELNNYRQENAIAQYIAQQQHKIINEMKERI